MQTVPWVAVQEDRGSARGAETEQQEAGYDTSIGRKIHRAGFS